MEPMFAAIASRRQAADEHGQKPQNTAAGKSRQEHAETRQESFQQAYKFLPSGLPARGLITLSHEGSAVALQVTEVQCTISRGHTRRFNTPDHVPKQATYTAQHYGD